jgi:hypothetical protein
MKWLNVFFDFVKKLFKSKHERGCVSFKFLIQITYLPEYTGYYPESKLVTPDYIKFAWTVDKRYLHTLIEWSGRVNHIIHRSLMKRYRPGTWYQSIRMRHDEQHNL